METKSDSERRGKNAKCGTGSLNVGFNVLNSNHLSEESGADQLWQQLGHTNEDQKHSDQTQSEHKLELDIVCGYGEVVPAVQLHERR